MSNGESESVGEIQVIWRRLAEKIGGRYSRGTDEQEHLIVIPHRKWTISLDAYMDSAVSQADGQAIYTRIRVPYVTRDRFRMRVHHEGFWSRIGKLLGMQDILVGDRDFDEAFIVKSNQEEQVTRFFAEERIREIFLENKSIYLEVGDAEGRFRPPHEGAVYELYHRERRLIADTDYLEELHELFVLSLDRLHAIKSAEVQAPVFLVDTTGLLELAPED